MRAKGWPWLRTGLEFDSPDLQEMSSVSSQEPAERRLGNAVSPRFARTLLCSLHRLTLLFLFVSLFTCVCLCVCLCLLRLPGALLASALGQTRTGRSETRR